jgi:hypothetical protein
MKKIYFFRHIIDGTVILSKTPLLYNHHLPQVGMHRPGIRLRRDHWTPFLLFESQESLESIFENLYSAYKYPIGKVRYPLPAVTKALSWSIPEPVKSRIMKLNSLLLDTKPLEGKMYWERLDYQKLAEWPGSISHDKLILSRNCIPFKQSAPTLKPYRLKTTLEY